jgi:hypothetical protein
VPRPSVEPMIRVHLWLSVRDIERIDTAFGTKIKRSEAVRLLIGATLDQIDAKAANNAHALPVPRLNLRSFGVDE